MKKSQRWSLIKQDLKKIGIGAGIALLGALATYMADTIPSIDFGSYSILVYAFNSVLINAIRKFLTSTVYVK